MGTLKYSKPTIYLHWISVVAISVSWVIGFLMSDYENSDNKLLLIGVHIALGFIVMVLTITRVYFALTTERPERVRTGNNLQDLLIPFIHYLMLVVIIFIGISGMMIVISKGLQDAFVSGNYLLLPPPVFNIYHKYHEMLSFLFVVLLVAHVLGIGLFYLKKKENLIKRIS